MGRISVSDQLQLRVEGAWVGCRRWRERPLMDRGSHSRRFTAERRSALGDGGERIMRSTIEVVRSCRPRGIGGKCFLRWRCRHPRLYTEGRRFCTTTRFMVEFLIGERHDRLQRVKMSGKGLGLTSILWFDCHFYRAVLHSSRIPNFIGLFVTSEAVRTLLKEKTNMLFPF